MAGGVLTLTPTFMDEFGSTALGSGWSSSVLDTGGTTTVAGGLATLTGTQVLGTSTYTTPSSVAWNATLSAADQRLGWYSASPALSAVFGRDSSGNLVALTVDAAGHNTTSPISGTFTAGPHEYRVDWSATTATYFIDGVQVATAPFAPGTTPLRIVASDDVVVGGGMPIDWVRVAPFSAPSGCTPAVAGSASTTHPDAQSDRRVHQGDHPEADDEGGRVMQIHLAAGDGSIHPLHHARIGQSGDHERDEGHHHDPDIGEQAEARDRERTPPTVVR